MSALFLFLIQLLQAVGFPIDVHTGGLIGVTSAPHNTHHTTTYKTDGSDSAGKDLDDPSFEQNDSPCDISNGF